MVPTVHVMYEHIYVPYVLFLGALILYILISDLKLV